MRAAIGASIRRGVAQLCLYETRRGECGSRSAVYLCVYGCNGAVWYSYRPTSRGMHSSQNEQDNRNYAKAARIPMLEPSDSAECLAMVKEAYEISGAV